MNLKRFLDTLTCTPAEESARMAPQSVYMTRSYGSERGCVEDAPVVITASFETPWTSRRKSSSPTVAVVHRKGSTGDGSTQAAPTVLSSNPIAQFLQPDKNVRGRVAKAGGGPAVTKGHAKAKSTRCNSRPVVIPTVTQNRWSLRAVAPLIQWLQHHRVRYAYADWECQHTNGTRMRTVSQHGVVVEDREAATQAEYVCESSFGQNLYVRTCRTAYVPGSGSTYDWWSDVKAGAVTPLPGGGTKHLPMAFSVRPSERESGGCNRVQTPNDADRTAQARPVDAKNPTTGDAQDQGVSTNNDAPDAAGGDPLATSVLSYAAAGVYSQVRQHRVYRWDRATSVHLSTTDGKAYRVWLEHCVEDASLQKEFRKLLAALAYHFSFHA